MNRSVWSEKLQANKAIQPTAKPLRGLSEAEFRERWLLEKGRPLQRFKTVPDYLVGHDEWRPVLERLRAVINESDLEETVKWGLPCYTLGTKNVMGLGAFKEFVSVWFFQGALLRDKHGVLVNAQEGRTKPTRQWRFRNEDEINEDLLRSYAEEAIENQRKGREIKADRNKPLQIPTEFAAALSADTTARERFDALSPGKRREYAEHIADARREETRKRRLEKIMPGDETGISGHISALGHEPHNYTLIYVQVDDLDAYIAKAEALGGSSMIPPTEVPGMGHFAWIMDRTCVGLWKPLES